MTRSINFLLACCLLGMFFCATKVLALKPYVTEAKEVSNSSSKLEQEADLCRDQKQYDKAIALYTRILQQNGRSHQAYGNRAYCYLLQKRFSQALADQNHALEIKDCLQCSINRANTLYELKRYEDAKQSYINASKKKPDADLLTSAASCAFELAEYDQADKLCSQALALNPQSSSAYDLRSWVREELNKVDLAFTDAERACALNPKNANAYLALAYAELVKKLAAKAIQDCNRAIAIDKGLGLAYAVQSLAYSLTDDRKKAMADAETAVSLAPGLALPYVARAGVECESQMHEKSIQDSSKAISPDPHCAWAFAQRAHTESIHLGRNDEAIKDATEAIRLQPDYAFAFANRAIASLQNGDVLSGMRDYQKAISLDPSNVNYFRTYGVALRTKSGPSLIQLATAQKDKHPNDAQAWIDLAACYALNHENDRAIEFYSKAIGVNPRSDAAYECRAENYEELGKLDLALADFKMAAGLAPNHAEHAYDCGRMFQQQGKFKEAWEAYSKALSLDRHYPQAYNNRGLCKDKLGDLPSAMSDYNAALKLDPDLLQAYGNRGSAYMQKKQYELAVSDFTKTIPLDAIHAREQRARAYFALGQKQKALDDFQLVAKQDPKNADIQYCCGTVLIELKRYREAIPFLSQALQLNPNSAEAHVNRAICLREISQYDQGLKDLSEAVTLKPDLPQAYSARAAIYGKLKNYQEQLNAISTAISLEKDPSALARLEKERSECKAHLSAATKH